jgi:type IV secretory pathway ATPase VirB11/archaellum biosynthesis ATPase
MPVTTYHTYAELLLDGGRLAVTEWGGRHGMPSVSLADGVAATLRLDPEAIILQAVRGSETVRGYAPAGMAA